LNSKREAFRLSSAHVPPDASYPTVLPSETKLEELWLGKTGQIFFGDALESDIAIGKRMVDALKTLPVRQVTQRAHDSVVRKFLGMTCFTDYDKQVAISPAQPSHFLVAQVLECFSSSPWKN